MARRCDLTGKGVLVGNNVSHAKNKTRKRFLPNLQNISFISEALGATLSLRVAASTLRSVDHNGGLDNFLITTADKDLSSEAVKLKKKIKKALAAA